MSRSPTVHPLFFILLGAILAATYYHFSAPDPISPTSLRSQGYHFVSPLLDYDFVPNQTTNQHLYHLKDQVEALLEQQTNQNKINNAAVYYRELNDGPWFGINERELFSPGSLVKVPLMIAYFRQAESDPSILSRKINYDVPPDPLQNFKPSISLDRGRDYTVDDLIRQMIVRSDNTTHDLLFKNIDIQHLSRVYADLGVALDQNQTANILSVRNYASFFRVLYNASYLNPAYSEKALSLLAQTEFRQGLVGPLPADIQVSHKFGERYFTDQKLYQLHDCGIIYYPQKPYLLCVMTQGRNFDDLSATLQLISAACYRHQSPTN